jgi:glycosyltransferase 2 family protein
VSVALPGWTQRARRWAGPIVSVISLAAVLWWALHQQAPRWPTGTASLLLLGLAVLVYAAVTIVRGIRWHAILNRADVPLGMADAQALVVVGYMGNTVLPARGGELLRIFLAAQRTGSSKITVLGTIVAERLLDVLALLALLVTLAAVTTTGLQSSIHDLHIDPAIGMALLVLVLALVLGGVWVARARVRAGRLSGLRARIASLTLATRNLLSAQGLLLIALTAAVWLGEGLVYWLVGDALQLGLSIAQSCFLVVLSSLVAIIPAAPGYAGTYDAAIQLGLRGLGIGGGPAIAFGLLVRLVIFLPITVAGLILMVFRYGGLSSLGRLRRQAPMFKEEEPAPEQWSPGPSAPAAVAPTIAHTGTAGGASLMRSPVPVVDGRLELVSK